MARDIEAVTLPNSAAASARLCNFPTAQDTLLASHKAWIDTHAAPLLAKSPNPWVDLFGFASHLGIRAFNKQLSDRRCAAVMAYVRGIKPQALFPQDFGFGDSKSTGGPTDNDGYWRAVEVYVYASMPPGKVARPPVALPVPDDWYVTYFSGSTFSVVIALGFTAITGHITFEKPNGVKYNGPIGLFGGSVGLSFVPNLSKIPGISGLMTRFPAIAQVIAPGSTGLSNAFMKWLMTSPSGVARLLWSHPMINHAINAVRGAVSGASGSAESWWSGAIGKVWGSRGRTVSVGDFAGPCICYALTGTVAVAGFGAYVLFFGLDRSWNPLTDPLPLVDLMRLEGKAKGVAVLSAASVAAQIPGLGAGATVFWGEIV